jgi:hypothetical protein
VVTGGVPRAPGSPSEDPSPEPTPCCPLPPGGKNDEPRQGQIIYRVYGGESGPFGPWWTPIDPHEVQRRPDLVAQWGRYAYRATAGLPDTNTGEWLIVAELKNPAAAEPLEAGSMETKLHPDGRWPRGLPSFYGIRVNALCPG